MTTLIRAQNAEDFLALVPHLTGFQPCNSIVLVAFRGKRTCGALRCDLPKQGSPPAVLRRAATTMVGMICRIPDVDALVPVVYADSPFAPGRSMPGSDIVTVLLSRARYSGFLVRDALCVASDAWASYLDDDAPRGGRPLALIGASAAQKSLIASEDAGSLLDLDTESALPVAALEPLERTAQKYSELDRLRHSPELEPALVFDHGFSGDVVAFAERLISIAPIEISPADGALLAFAVSSPCLRDEILLTWAWGTRFGLTVAEMNDRHNAGEDIGDLPGSMALGGFDMPRPAPERLRSAIELLRVAASRVPRRARPPLLTMIAWSHWALGAGTLAGRWTDQARAIDRSYRLAELLDTMLQAGHLPEWAWAVPPDVLTSVTIDR
ncbi:hypothetical protein IWX78_002670 [Mycetocola sp. CAN_C7]|uniref:DUF4192 family protein n=1 Tax=Mycetocola sp. CAN_C7 TaxID=2787724 RepID=UPI0018C93640